MLYWLNDVYKGCLLCSLHGPRWAHLLLHWHLDGLALRMFPLILFAKSIAEWG